MSPEDCVPPEFQGFQRIMPPMRLTLSPSGLREHVLMVGHTLTQEDTLDFLDALMDRVYVSATGSAN